MLAKTKLMVKSYMCLTYKDLVEAVQDSWHEPDQKSINNWVDEIPEILKSTIKLEGKMSEA